jgi:hypothetical protein
VSIAQLQSKISNSRHTWSSQLIKRSGENTVRNSEIFVTNLVKLVPGGKEFVFTIHTFA